MRITILTALLAGLAAAPAQGQTLRVDALEPAAAPAGATISVRGTGFAPIAPDNTVFFGPVGAEVVASLPNELRVVVPTGAAYGPVTVVANGLSARSATAFLVTFAGGGELSADSFERFDFNVAQREASSLGVGDFDRDGRPDVLVSNWDGELAILHNQSTPGTPLLIQVGALHPGVGGGDIVVEDFDRDGLLDAAIVLWRDHRIVIYRNTSSAATISFDQPVSLPTRGIPPIIQAPDVDRDGRPDLVILESDGSAVAVFKNLATPGVLTAGSFAAPSVFPLGFQALDMDVADVNGDGKIDVVCTNWDQGGFAILTNQSQAGIVGGASFGAAMQFRRPGTRGRAVTLADLNADDRPDVIVTSTDDSVTVYRSQVAPTQPLGSASFAAPFVYETGRYPAFIEIGDFNGDQLLDMAIPYQGTGGDIGFSVYENQGSATEISGDSFSLRTPLGSDFYPYHMAVADFDGDGQPDIAAPITQGHKVSLFLNRVPSDSTPPVLELPEDVVAVATGAEGAAVLYAASATDEHDPAPVVDCSPASGATFPIGVTTVTCTARDHAGNESTGSFSVHVTYLFSGFRPPIANDGPSSFKIGRTLPVKFGLLAGSDATCDATATIEVSIEGVAPADRPDDGGAFRCDLLSQQYLYNLRTDGYGPGRHVIRVHVSDGTVHEVLVTLRR